MDEHELKLILEALLMTNRSPISIEKIQSVFEEGEAPQRQQIINSLKLLNEDYKHRAIELIEVANGYRLQTKSAYKHWVEQLFTEKPGKYSRALIETLAIIAYRQPVTRGDIEEIRGVAVSTHIIRTLLDREWIRVAGHRDVPGKAAVYSTTKAFLDYFNLQSLDALPPLQAMELETQE